jgi:hypothetical protein
MYYNEKFIMSNIIVLLLISLSLNSAVLSEQVYAATGKRYREIIDMTASDSSDADEDAMRRAAPSKKTRPVAPTRAKTPSAEDLAIKSTLPPVQPSPLSRVINTVYSWLGLAPVAAERNIILVEQEKLFENIFGCEELLLKRKGVDVLSYDPSTQSFHPPRHTDKPLAVGYKDTASTESDFFIWPYNGTFKDKPINCGKFKEYSIDELRGMSNDPSSASPGKFNIIERPAGAKKFNSARKSVDCAALQADPANRDAVFQVASNFNALEGIDAYEDVQKKLLGSYIHDKTQGPAASLGGFGALCLRRYFLNFTDKYESFANCGQTRDSFVNFLSDIASLTMSQAGYVDFRDASRPASDIKPPTEDDYKKIKIGVHKNVQVVAGYIDDHGQQEVIDDSSQIIHQIYTAAVDLANTNQSFRLNPSAIKWAQIILKAAYEGTLRATYIMGKKRVFLTLIGGGVFGNNQEWIADALLHMKDFIVASGLDVTLVWYNAGSKIDETKLRKKLSQLVLDTGGKHTIVGV